MSSAKNKSFTVIELIVVIAIVGLVSGIFLAHYRSGEQVSDLQTYSQKIVGLLKQAQSLALAGQEMGYLRPGYGVYFSDTQTYLLFADLNDNNTYNPGDTVIQSFTLPTRLTIDNINASNPPANFLFKPPLAEFYLNGTKNISDNTITIKHTSLNRTLTIHVQGLSGQIDLRP
jgi:Tfp pilus assembly protein FimT